MVLAEKKIAMIAVAPNIKPYSGTPGSKFFPSRIPDSNFFYPGSQIRIKEFKYCMSKKWFLSSPNYDAGCSSQIRILTFYPSRGQKGPGSRIWIRNTAGTIHNYYRMCTFWATTFGRMRSLC
jgi:hypothetical protein